MHKYKLKRLVVSEHPKMSAAEPSVGKTLLVNSSMRIIADDKYLEEVEKHSIYNRARRESDREASLAYADTRIAR